MTTLSRNCKLPLVEHLPTNRLPTELQVLGHFLWIQLQKREFDNNQTAKDVISAVKVIWDNAFIPMQDEHNAVRHFLKDKGGLYLRYRNLVKRKEKMENGVDKMGKTLFNVIAQGAVFRNEEDREFFLDQQTKRKATIGSVDIVDTLKIRRNIARRASDKRYMERPLRANDKKATNVLEVEENLEDDDDDWLEKVSLATKYRRISKTVTLTLDKKTWVNNVAVAADTTVTSNRVALKIATAAVSGSMNGNLDELVASPMTMLRRKETMREKIENEVRYDFKKEIERGDQFCVHWDEKMLKGFRHVDTSHEYMAVVLCNVMTGQDRIIDIVEMNSGTAEVGARAVTETLVAWGITGDYLIGGAFDTTNTNSGGTSGIISRIELKLGKRLLHIYCRHHSYERLVNDVADLVLGISTSPETTLYKRLQDIWLQVDTAEIELLPSGEWTRKFVEFCQQYLRNCSKASIKDDYKEVVVLSLLLLGEFPQDLSYSVHSVGSVSSARWMAKVICELKIALYSTQLIALGMITANEAQVHRRLASFLLQYYVRQWLQCTDGTNAAPNDLALYKDLLKANKEHVTYANAMLNRLDAHLWFLSEELVVLCLFSTNLTDHVKRQCAKQMLQYWGRMEEGYTRRGKLITPELRERTQLWDLFGPGSWLLFKLLGIEGKSFVKKSVGEWESDMDYRKVKNVVENIKVVNDGAERAILLAKTMQNKLSRKEAQRKRLFLSIPYAREKLENLKKNSLFSCDFSYL